jgi:hypothetical protein
MNQDEHDNRAEQALTNRRKFLRQVGMTAAATAAVAGFADVTGVTWASAAAKGRISGKEAKEFRAQNPRPPHIEKRIQEIRERRATDPQAFASSSFGSYSYCIPTPGQCNGVGGPCPKGKWCHLCCSDYSYCGGKELRCWHQCLPGDYEICNAIFS